VLVNEDAAAATAAAPAAPSQPQPTVISRQPYGDWMHVCVELPGGAGVLCSIFQLLTDQTSKQGIFQWPISQDGEGGLVSS
jgi:invasion protein IalB